MKATVKVYPDPESRQVVTVDVSNCEVAGGNFAQAGTGKAAGGKGGGAAAAASSKGAGGGGGGGLGSEAAAAAKQGIQDALMRGPAAGMPVIGVVAELLSVDAGEGVVINPGMLRVACTRAASAAMVSASPAKMHPLMSVEVTVSQVTLSLSATCLVTAANLGPQRSARRKLFDILVLARPGSRDARRARALGSQQQQAGRDRGSRVPARRPQDCQGPRAPREDDWIRDARALNNHGHSFFPNVIFPLFSLVTRRQLRNNAAGRAALV
jgi:hypothetical protein